VILPMLCVHILLTTHFLPHNLSNWQRRLKMILYPLPDMEGKFIIYGVITLTNAHEVCFQVSMCIRKVN
jgi:hypothetical protein